MLKFPLIEIETYFIIRLVLCADIHMMSIQSKSYLTKVKLNKNIFYFGIISKPNVGILGIAISIWKHNDFETIFTYNDVMNIQYVIGKIFGYR